MDNGLALVQAMLYGRLNGLSPETIFLYGRTGLLHLFSASGFHMGAALFLARMLTLALKPPKKIKSYLAFGISFGLMTFFGTQTDWSSPLVRAYAFTTLLAAAQLVEVRASRFWVFALSLVCSWFLGKGSSLSFCLSALGMAGVLWIGGRNLFIVSLGPWLFTLPVIIGYFYQFSLSSPLWNVTLGLLISCTVLPLAILDLILQSLHIPSPFLDLAAYGMEEITKILSAGDALLGLTYWVEPKSFFFFSALFVLACFYKKILLLLFIPLALFWPKANLALLDVGQGDSIYLNLPQGERLLVDAGPKTAAVNRALEKLGIGSIDHLLLTHTDKDHMGGIPALLSRHKIKNALWLRPELLANPKIFFALSAAEKARLKIKFLSSKEAPPGLRCWLPPFHTSNEASPFCHGQIKGGQSIWLTGDGGEVSENWLLQQEARIPTADFLKVGHHGSKFSSSANFLRATRAHTALISCGRKNPYGHPAQEVLERLEDQNIFVRRTDQEGSITSW